MLSQTAPARRPTGVRVSVGELLVVAVLDIHLKPLAVQLL